MGVRPRSANHYVNEPGRVRGDAAWAVQRYEEFRSRYPAAEFPVRSKRWANLGDLTDRYDAFLLDSFGVLNRGDRTIDGALSRVASLRRAGRRLLVLTNGATTPLARLTDKYCALGFDFGADEILSSREVLAAALRDAGDGPWGVAAPAHAEIDELPVACVLLGDAPDPYERAGGFIFLSSLDWSETRQQLLIEALYSRSRPLLVGNPDLVAPYPTHLNLEPGHYAWEIAEATGIEPRMFGKPYGNMFEAAIRRLGNGIPRERILMVGDTLHTDILGAAAAGLDSVLVTGHGLLQALDVDACIAHTGIVPAYIIPGI